MNITGQIVFREAGNHHQLEDRRLMMFTGIIAVPKVCIYKGEHQYVLIGNDEGQQLTVYPQAIDRTELFRGMELGNMVTEPIWKF